MTSSASQSNDLHHISAVALDLLRKPASPKRGSGDPAVMREWIEKRLASGSDTISGIELHREIEAGIPGQSIPTLILVLEITRGLRRASWPRSQDAERPGPARPPLAHGQ